MTKQPVASGVSTNSTPITLSRCHSGAHIAERIWCNRTLMPAEKRSSDCASEVSTATRWRVTRSRIVCEIGASASAAPLRERAMRSSGLPSG